MLNLFSKKLLSTYGLALAIFLLGCMATFVVVENNQEKYQTNVNIAFQKNVGAMFDAINKEFTYYYSFANDVAAFLLASDFSSQSELLTKTRSFIKHFSSSGNNLTIERINVFKRINATDSDIELQQLSTFYGREIKPWSVVQNLAADKPWWLAILNYNFNETNQDASLGYITDLSGANGETSLNAINNRTVWSSQAFVSPFNHEQILVLIVAPVLQQPQINYLVVVNISLNKLAATLGDIPAFKHLLISGLDDQDNCRFSLSTSHGNLGCNEFSEGQRFEYHINQGERFGALIIQAEADYETYNGYQLDETSTLISGLIFSLFAAALFFYIANQRYVLDKKVQLQTQDLRYLLLLKNAADIELKQATLNCNKNDVGTGLNPEIKALLGYTSEEMDGFQSILSVTHPDDKTVQAEFLKTYMAIVKGELVTKEMPTLLHRLRTKQGDYLWIKLNLVKIDEENFVLGFRNVDEEVRANLQLKEALKVKNTFMGRMSHELRTPLNGIMGMLDILKSEVPAKHHNFIDVAKSSSEHLLTLVEDILDAQDIANDKLILRSEATHLSEFLSHIELMIKAAYKSSQVSLTFHIENLPNTLFTDQRRLKQVLINLLNNAMKFTLEGKVTLSVSVVQYVDEKAHIQFQLSDTGIGIDASKLDYIFKEFAQVDETNTRKFDGSGIGLHLSKLLVEAMQGTITVESKLGIGSTFTVVIPMKLQDKSDYEGSVEKQSDISLVGKTAVIVDDIETNLVVLTLMLEKLGMQVTSFVDPFDAIDHVVKHHPDVVLTDIDMPSLNGAQLCQSLRRQNFQGVVLAVTGHALPNEIEQMMKSPFDGYILKPVQTDSLKQALLKLISTAKRH